jgi:phosphatidylethanolamine-binding protein
MIDQDVHYNGTAYTMLHWFRPGLRRNTNDDAIPGASYNPPNPPPGSGAHRYTFVLYAQPEDFAVPEQYAAINPPAETIDRVAFNLTAFASAANLGDPIAANYLRVINGTEAESSSVEAATGTIGVAPTESPTFIASTTESEAPPTSTASAETTSENGSSSTEATSPAETATEDSGAFATMRTSSIKIALGVALAGVGALSLA